MAMVCAAMIVPSMMLIEYPTQAARRKMQTPTVSSPRRLRLAHGLIRIIEPEAGQKEIFSSWALFILIMLLIIALFTSYLLQQKKIQAVHETVISIFAGISSSIQNAQRHVPWD